MADAATPLPLIVHNVYFALNEPTAANRNKLIEGCRKYLTGHPGTIYFGIGTPCQSLRRPVNDLDYDVGLHIIFRSLADHDAYQPHPRHQQFIEEHKSMWKKVRVFDSEVA